MKLTKLQFLNITTGRLHTEMDDIYKFFNDVIADGIMTHNLPNAYKAIRPILTRKYPEYPQEGFFPTFLGGEEEIEVMLSKEEIAEFWASYGQMEHPFAKLSCDSGI